MKKTLSLVLSLLMAVALLPALVSAEGTPLFDEPFEINILATTWQPYDTSITAIWDEIQRLTNVKLNFEWAPETDFDTKVATVLASGIDAMPDMISGNPTTKPMLLDQGAIIPLDDYIFENAPNLTGAMVPEDYTGWWREFFDGKIYSIPAIHDMPGAMSYMIRTDWLERVGKEIPTTWDELVDVLRAFKEQDANGDGDPNNEIPFALDNRYGLDGLMYIFGIMASSDGQFCMLPDGTYSVVYEHPNFQKFAEATAMLYAEGLFDPEFAVPRNQDMLFQIMDNNTCGFTMTWAERSRISTEVNAEVDPAAEWLCIAPIAGPDGDQMIRARAKTINHYFVTVGAEKRGKVEKILQFVNWLYSEEGNRLMNFGLEGVHHEIVDGEPVLLEPYNSGFVAARQAGLIHSPFIYNFLPEAYMQLLTSGLSYDELSVPQQHFYDGMFKVNNDYFVKQPPTYQTEAFIEYQAEVMTAVKVLREKVLSGQVSYDEYRAEYEKLLPRGLQDIIDQGNEAYQMVSGG